MKFKYSVIGRNTEENREWLEKLGKRRTSSIKGNVLFTQEDTYYCFTLEGGNNLIFDNNCIDGRNNDALFRAVSALRDDSDIWQYFLICKLNSATEEYETIWRMCITEKFDEDTLPYNIILIAKKAELTELQEHFKK